MTKIILAPYSARLPTNNPNPKNFRQWPEVVKQLNALGHEVTQIGVSGEERIEGVARCVQNWPLKKLRELIEECDTWISVDSFLPHFVFSEGIGKRGVVVWGLSDPSIWGHPTNINLLKDRKYLRPLQFQHWFDVEYNEDAFVSPEEVVEAVIKLASSDTRPVNVQSPHTNSPSSYSQRSQ